MRWDIVEAKVTGDLEFSVRFANGLTGKVRLLPSHLYGVFERLKDPQIFNQLTTTDGFVSWPDEIDLAPDAMYEAIKVYGEWVLEWLTARTAWM
jgi:hypothetical protein